MFAVVKQPPKTMRTNERTNEQPTEEDKITYAYTHQGVSNQTQAQAFQPSSRISTRPTHIHGV